MNLKTLAIMLAAFCMSIGILTSCGEEEPLWTPVEPEPVENQDNNPRQDEKEVAITGATGEIGDSYAIIFGVVNTDAINVRYESIEFGAQVSSSSDFSGGKYYAASSMSGSTITVRASSLTGKTNYWYRIYVKISSYPYYYYGNSKTFTTLKSEEKEDEMNKINGHEYVDLGLPSGTLWATMNIGAYKQEGVGDYFAWGETNSKNNFNWATYFDSSAKTYCSGKRTILEVGNDAACKKWGNRWHIPTRQQWDELISYCNWSWSTINGVKGYMVWDKTWKKSIFLPAAGFYEESTLRRKGEIGCYWTSYHQF